LSTLVGRMPAGAVDLGGSNKAASVGYPVGAINFAPIYSAAEDAMARSIVRLECEAEELRASIALLEAERDLLRVQVRAGEGLGMALVKSIGQLKEEKADLVVKLNNLQGGQNE
jgi:class 3 adenylate cyclase